MKNFCPLYIILKHWCFIISMSLFYQVMAAARCPKIKKHVGIKLKVANKGTKEPFKPGDVLIYQCESTEFVQTIKCLDDGRWSELPHCPDPSNSTCKDLEPIPHGSWNSSGPYKVGSIVSFKCDDDTSNSNQLYNINNNDNSTTYHLNDTIKSTIPATTTTILNSNDNFSNSIKYNVTGHKVLKCLPSSKWNHPMPSCSPILPESKSNFNVMLTSAIIILIPLLIFIAIFQIFIRWRKRKQQRARWKQYFTDYKYRHSKTSITFGMRPQNSTSNTTIPVTDL